MIFIVITHQYAVTRFWISVAFTHGLQMTRPSDDRNPRKECEPKRVPNASCRRAGWQCHRNSVRTRAAPNGVRHTKPGTLSCQGDSRPRFPWPRGPVVQAQLRAGPPRRGVSYQFLCRVPSPRPVTAGRAVSRMAGRSCSVSRLCGRGPWSGRLWAPSARSLPPAVTPGPQGASPVRWDTAAPGSLEDSPCWPHGV